MFSRFLLLITTVLAFFPSFAQANQSTTPSTYAQPLQQLAQAYHEVYGFTGSIKVVKGDKPLFEASYGLANREFGIANRPDFPISINSISKTFTAVAILKLVESGQLDLHQPISEYLPELTAVWKDQVTVHHLLTHSSGLPRESGIQWYQDLSLQQQVSQLIDQQQLLFAPGERYEYSNAGITLLGRIIETVSQQSFADYMTNEIIEPLKLTSTGVYIGQQVVPQQVTPYRLDLNGVVQAPRSKHMGENAGGGLYSTVNDLYKFVTAIEQHQLLSAATTGHLLQPYMEIEGGDAASYGWTLKSFGTRKLLFASGSGYGTKSVMIRSPEQGDFIAVTANWGNTPILQLMAGLFMIINDMDYDIPDSRMLAQPERYKKFIGRYQFEPGLLKQHMMIASDSVNLQKVDGKLFLNDELLAVQEGESLGLTYTNEVVIEFADDKLVIDINGNKLVGIRQR